MDGMFLIKENNIGCKERCPICGDVHKASIGFTVFYENENGMSLPICHECQEEKTPDFRKMLDFHHGKNSFCDSIEGEDSNLHFTGKLEDYIESLSGREPATVVVLFKMSGYKEIWKVTDKLVHITGVGNFSEGTESYKIDIRDWESFFMQGLGYRKDSLIQVVDLGF